MLSYIVGLFIFFTAYRKVNLFLIKRSLKRSKYISIMKGSEPFFFKGDDTCKTGVLLLHGFTATPDEMKGLGKYLNQKGLTVHAPLLSGHGTDPRKLLITKHDDWLRDIDKALNVLSGCCNEIYLIGNSFGGNLAFLGVEKNKKIKGIISLASPFLFKNESLRRGILHSVKHFKLFQKKRPNKKVKEIYFSTKRISYKQIPLYSLLELNKIVKKSKEILPKIKGRVLLVQSTNDDVVSKESIYFAFNKIKSKDKKIVWVKDSIHVFIADKKGKRVFKEIYNFIIKK